MKITLNILFIVLSLSALSAQQPLDSAYIASKTSYFAVEGSQITGEGLKVLQEIAQSSQFIAWGERHNSATTSAFMQAFLPILAKNDFDHFALEVGPHSVKRLQEATVIPNNTIQNLRAFNTQYFDLEIQRELIPFFAGVEDAAFLQTAAESKMELWGLDQEYYYAILFLTDDLLNTAQKHPEYEQLEKKKLEADAQIRMWLRKDNRDEVEGSVFQKMSEDPVIRDFFKTMELASSEAKQIIDDLLLSWDIYTRWKSGSHADRISYMRNNFMKHYSEAKQKQAMPKVFLKFGQVHTSRELSIGTYDLGHLVSELAQKNGTRATTINSWTRFKETEEGSFDYMQEPHNWYPRLNVFFQFGDKNNWTIIDLKAIRKDYEEGKIALPNNGDYHAILKLIKGYDYQFILPTDHKITYNLER